MKRILDRGFKYVPAARTDIAKTFRRIRQEQAAIAEEQRTKVEPLKRRKAE